MPLDSYGIRWCAQWRHQLEPGGFHTSVSRLTGKMRCRTCMNKSASERQIAARIAANGGVRRRPGRPRKVAA